MSLLPKSFSKFNVRMNHLLRLLKCRCWFSISRREPEILHFNKLLGKVNVASLQTTLLVAKILPNLHNTILSPAKKLIFIITDGCGLCHLICSFPALHWFLYFFSFLCYTLVDYCIWLYTSISLFLLLINIICAFYCLIFIGGPEMSVSQRNYFSPLSL